MTVNITDARATATGTGTTGPFTIPFSFEANSHLKVYKETTSGSNSFNLLTETTDYTFTAGTAPYTENEAQITFTANVNSGVDLLYVRDTPQTQTADLPNLGGAYNPQEIEDALDRTIRIVQDFGDDVSRSVKFAEGTNNTAPVLPSPNSTDLLGWDGSGQLENKIVASPAFTFPSFTGNADKVAIVNTAENNFEYVAGIDTINSGEVVTAKLGSGAVTTAKISDSNVTFAKIVNISENQILGRTNTGSGVVNALTMPHRRLYASTFSAASTVNLTSLVDTTKYLGYLIRLQVSGTSNGTLLFRFSTDNGATFISSNYQYGRYQLTSAGVAGTGQSASGSAVDICPTSGSTDNLVVSDILLYTHAAQTSLQHKTFVHRAGTDTLFTVGYGWNSTNNINAFQFYNSAGTISGAALIYGLVL